MEVQAQDLEGDNLLHRVVFVCVCVGVSRRRRSPNTTITLFVGTDLH